jgi:hypothetical protein
VVTPARTAVAAANGIDLATTDAVPAKAATSLGPEDTAKAVRRWVAGIDPDGALDDQAGMSRVVRMRSAWTVVSTSAGTSTPSVVRPCTPRSKP